MTIIIQTAPIPGEGTYKAGLSVLGDYDAADMQLHTTVGGKRYPTEQEAAGAALAAAIRQSDTETHVRRCLEQTRK
jgi:hypothetical protein